MVGGIAEIAEAGRSLSLERGFLRVESEHTVLGRIPLDDIEALIISGNGCTLTSPLLGALAERGAVTILCGKNYIPIGMLLPVEGVGSSASRIRLQVAASEPLKKRLWQKIVQMKIRLQSEVLKIIGQEKAAEDLLCLCNRVNSGDTDNKEAQAARKYWPILFGSSFRRSDENNPINSMLNYGYAIIRGAAARAVVGVGLLPQLGIKHKGPRDTFALADDLMEPYRPLIDLKVKLLSNAGHTEMTSDIKRELARLLLLDVVSKHGTSCVSEAFHISAFSLVESFESKKEKLCLINPLQSIKNSMSTSVPSDLCG